MRSHDDRPSLSCAQLERIVSLCDQFEQSWRVGERPRIEAFLTEIDNSDALLKRLLLLELDHRKEAGETISPEEYRARFVDSPTVINAVFARETAVVNGPGPEAEPDPTKIGRYSVLRRVGAGGFGRVYLARDEDLKRTVAVKVPRREAFQSDHHIDLFLNEARMAAQLRHPAIVAVYDIGRQQDGSIYIVLEYVDGRPLSEVLKAGDFPLERLMDVLARVAEAVHAANKQGLVHRDLKPANILIDVDGKPHVADFGLAVDEDSQLKRTGEVAGTVPYMAPEQVQGETHRLDGRTDVWALGVILYNILAGRNPFSGSMHELLDAIRYREPKPPRQIKDTIPKELERICLKCLSKRMTDRYATALDLADDVRLWMAEAQIPAQALGPATLPIVPKGLRAFDGDDADFFLELLPGPRDRDGLPDSVRFWKRKIEQLDPDQTFKVGLIYGPSGCGKSSLVKAGLLPRLGKHILTVYIEATPEETEARLLKGLRKVCPELPRGMGLVDSLAKLRKGRVVSPAPKVLLVLDQFEQWLFARRGEQNTELVAALRQCDGEHLQAVAMVRDDFWMAATRFMRDLEFRLLEGENSAAVDLFDLDHARKVLSAFGRAFGKLPGNTADTASDQHEFLKQSVNGLAEEGEVISVRLALYAEMMKGKPWAPSTLKEVGGMKGVGVTFLEETFSASTAAPEHRLHQKAVEAVLRALLPETGTDIKGQMRSRQELLEVSGYADRPRDFDDLIHILDAELRLITPTDPEGVAGDEWRVAGGQDDSALSSPATHYPPPATGYYQLTHDYLVRSLRDWLTRRQRETRRGRAELRFAERAALWQAKPENRHLPSWWEYLAAVCLVPAKNRTAVQQTMLRKAGRIHAIRWGSALAILAMVGFVIGNVLATERQNSLRQQVARAVDAVQNNRGRAVPFTVRDLKRLPRALVVAEIKARYASAEPQHKLGLAYAMVQYGQVDVPFLVSQIERSAPEEVDNLVAMFGLARDAATVGIHDLSQKAAAEKKWPIKARLAIVALHLEDDRIAADMCHIDDRPDPIQRTTFIDELPAWHGDVTKLATYCQARSDAALRSGLCLAVGSIPLGQLTDAERKAWEPVLTEWYETASDGGTHSAAGWALRRWVIEAPAPPATSQPSEGRQWLVNSLGMTLLKINPGVFVRKDRSPEAKDQSVQLTRAFFLSDQEVSVGQFQQFISDANYPNEEKPENWPGAEAQISPTRDHPVQKVNWYDAVAFCNWLSRKEGRDPCYERTGKKEKPQQNVARDVWRLVADATGYRLPTEAEWEYACRAGTTTDFASGSNEEMLQKYAVLQASLAAPGGSKLPNGWGLFDMHGNVWEWCWDGYGKYDANSPAVDPTGAAWVPDRVIRGGCGGRAPSSARASYRWPSAPGYRGNDLGFRVARGQ